MKRNILADVISTGGMEFCNLQWKILILAFKVLNYKTIIFEFLSIRLGITGCKLHLLAGTSVNGF